MAAEKDDEAARARRIRGAATLEYVLIGIVIALIALIVLVRFGGSLGGRYTDTSGRIEEAKARGESGGETANPEGGAGGRSAEGNKPSSAPGAAGGGEIEEARSDDASSADGKVRVGRLSFDMTTILWLGALVLVAATLIMVRAFAAAKAKPKPKI